MTYLVVLSAAMLVEFVISYIDRYIWEDGFNTLRIY